MATAAALALAVALLGPAIWGVISGPSAKDKIAADPAPILFSDTAIRPADALVAPEAAEANRLMASWWRSHGSISNDKAFLAWLQRSFPAPPSAGERKQELSILETANRRHTTTGVAAATWLEAHGKKDIWKLYAHDQAEWLSGHAGDTRKADMKALLKLSKKASHQLSDSFAVSAPYVLEPALAHKSHTIVNGCPCSYPSNHAAKAAAARTYLSTFQPHMADQYRWMEDEIDWSRIYMAGHVPSDISAGALLGDMVGEYFLVSRNGLKPAEARL
jgi:membrane-associated phospholipid phosphatase